MNHVLSPSVPSPPKPHPSFHSINPRRRHSTCRSRPAQADITMRSWSDLMDDIMAAIADTLCPPWRSASKDPAARRRARTPMLLLPPRDADERPRPVHRALWSLVDDSITMIRVPTARGHPFLFASPRGWTLAIGNDLSTTLLHPFTGASVALPDLPSPFRSYNVRDTVWDRSPHAVVIALTYERFGDFQAFFCRLGDESWSSVEYTDDPLFEVSTVTYCDGAFYLFHGDARKTVLVDGETFAVTAVIQPPALHIPEHLRTVVSYTCEERPTQSTLAVSSDELLMVVRTHLLLPAAYHGLGGLFRIFRADRHRRQHTRWEEVADIGSRAVFVDHLRAFCVEADGLDGVRGNCMYVASSYTDLDSFYGKYNVGVLDLADLTTKCLGMGNLKSHSSASCWQWPSWSMPNLHSTD